MQFRNHHYFLCRLTITLKHYYSLEKKKKLAPCRSSSPTLYNFERSKRSWIHGRGRGGGGRGEYGHAQGFNKNEPQMQICPNRFATIVTAIQVR